MVREKCDWCGGEKPVFPMITHGSSWKYNQVFRLFEKMGYSENTCHKQASWWEGTDSVIEVDNCPECDDAASDFYEAMEKDD